MGWARLQYSRHFLQFEILIIARCVEIAFGAKMSERIPTPSSARAATAAIWWRRSVWFFFAVRWVTVMIADNGDKTRIA